MWTQRDVTQMKEQIKTPEKKLNEMETSNLIDAEFKPLVIRMLKCRGNGVSQSPSLGR